MTIRPGGAGTSGQFLETNPSICPRDGCRQVDHTRCMPGGRKPGRYTVAPGRPGGCRAGNADGNLVFRVSGQAREQKAETQESPAATSRRFGSPQQAITIGARFSACLFSRRISHPVRFISCGHSDRYAPSRKTRLAFSPRKSSRVSGDRCSVSSPRSACAGVIIG